MTGTEAVGYMRYQKELVLSKTEENPERSLGNNSQRNPEKEGKLGQEWSTRGPGQ